LYVNPDFWESLMGWPIGCTGTAPLETAKTREWQRQCGIFSMPTTMTAANDNLVTPANDNLPPS
jgi:hypothetical protein